MRRQTYLVRKGARYHFRRRISQERGARSITVPLNTSDPVQARCLVRRLAVRWDDLEMHLAPKFERGTLTLQEREVLFRQGLEAEVAFATAHLTAPMGASKPPPSFHKIMKAAYGIVGRVAPDGEAATQAVIAEETDDSWTGAERDLLDRVLRLQILPATGAYEARETLTALGAPANAGTCREARSNLLRGRAEAHARAQMWEDRDDVSPFASLSDLLDDRLVRAAARDYSTIENRDQSIQKAEPVQTVENIFFARTTTTRFSEQIEDLLKAMFADNGWQPDNNKTRHMLEAFAWLTGDKTMSDYEPADIDQYVRRLICIPKDFNWGRLNKSGAMVKPFDPAIFNSVKATDRRSDRTINSHLSKLNAAAKVLKKTHWLPKLGYGQVMVFNDARKRVRHDDSNPPRVPLNKDTLVALYSLPLWQGGGNALSQVKTDRKPVVLS